MLLLCSSVFAAPGQYPCFNQFELPSYEEFVKQSRNPLRSDSIIALKLPRIASAISEFLQGLEILSLQKESTLVKLDVFPNGKVVFKLYSDSVFLDTIPRRHINQLLSEYRYDSIRNYKAVLEISYYSKRQNDSTTCPIFKTRYNSLPRPTAQLRCVVNNRYKELWNTYIDYYYGNTFRKDDVTFRIVINEFGKVTSCKVIKSTIKELRCEIALRDEILTWEFGQIYSPHDYIWWDYPFTFKTR
jgi:hypothetical protein